MAFIGKNYAQIEQLNLARRKQRADTDPAAIFVRELSAGGPRALYQTLGNVVIDAAKYNLFGGKEETQRRAFETSSIDLDRKRKAAVEFGGETETSYQQALQKHLRRFGGQQPKPADRQTPTPAKPTQPTVKDFGDGTYGIETKQIGQATFTDAATKKMFNPITKEEFDKYSAQQQKQEEQQKPDYKNWYQDQAKITYVGTTEKRMLGQTAAKEIREYATKLQEDGRKKLNSFNSRISSEFEAFGKDAFLKASEQKRKEKLNTIVGIFADQIETLPLPERQAAYKNLVGQAKIAMGDEDIYAAEKRILESPNGGKVRDYATYGDRSTRISMGQKTKTTGAIKTATVERERLATEAIRLMKIKENLMAQINKSDSFQKNRVVPADLDKKLLDTQKELDTTEQEYNLQNERINSLIGEEEEGGASEFTPLTKSYTNPYTGENVRGFIFTGEDLTQPESTRQKTAMARVSQRFNKDPKTARQTVLEWLLYNKPEDFKRFVEDPDSSVQDFARDFASKNVDINLFDPPSPNELRKRQQDDEDIILEMRLDATPVLEQYQNSKPLKKLGNSYESLTKKDKFDLIQIGRMSGIEPGVASQNFRTAKEKYKWLTPQNYSALSNDQREFLMNNLDKVFTNLEAFKNRYNVDRGTGNN